MSDVKIDKPKDKWDTYSKAYNELSDKMSEVGIDNMLLRKVVDLRVEYMDSCRAICPSIV